MTKRFVQVLLSLGLALPLVSAADPGSITASIKEAMASIFALIAGVGGGLADFSTSGNMPLFFALCVGFIVFGLLYKVLTSEEVKDSLHFDLGDRMAKVISGAAGITVALVVPQSFYTFLLELIMTGSDVRTATGLIPLALGFGIPALTYWLGSKWFSGESKLKGFYYIILAVVTEFSAVFVANGLKVFGQNTWSSFIPLAFTIIAIVTGVLGVVYLFRMFSGIAPMLSENLREGAASRLTEYARTQQQRTDLIAVDSAMTSTLEPLLEQFVANGIHDLTVLSRTHPVQSKRTPATPEEVQVHSWLKTNANTVYTAAKPSFSVLRRLFKSGLLGGRRGQIIIPIVDTIDTQLSTIKNSNTRSTNVWWNQSCADKITGLEGLETEYKKLLQKIQMAVVVAEDANQKAQRRAAATAAQQAQQQAAAGATTGAGTGTGGTP